VTKTVLVCEAQVPFVQGGAEFHVRELVRQLRGHGYDTELVSVPFKWYPKSEIFAHAAAWRLLDLSESNGRRIDLVIATKFPTYFARHPNKVAWLIHQYRAAYELAGTPYSDFLHVEEDVALKERIVALDRAMLGEVRGSELSVRTEELEPYRGRPIIVVCRAGVRSTTAAAMLYGLGYERVYNLKDGMVEWNDRKLPVER
jgi:rhodanese-related sulfurtransferase